MAQDIIVLIIVLIAVVYTIWSTIKTLKIKSTGCCGHGCACSAKTDIRNAILKKQKQAKVKSVVFY